MATIPAGYSEARAAFYYFTDGTGPYVIDSNGNAKLLTDINIAGGLIGALTQYGVQNSGPVDDKFDLTATGLPAGWTGPGIITGIRCLTNGTITGMYDAASAAGTNLMPGLAGTANNTYLINGLSRVRLNVSPWFVVASGTWEVFGLMSL